MISLRFITSKISSLHIKPKSSCSHLNNNSTKWLKQHKPSIYILSSPFSTSSDTSSSSSSDSSSSTSDTSSEKETGTVKFYAIKQAYGFILADKDEEEIFVHRTKIAGAEKGGNNWNPVLRQKERVQFKRISNEKGDGKFMAEDVVFEDGSRIPIYRSRHLAETSKKIKARLGISVYDILSEGGDEEEMAQKIAEAYTETRDQIDALQKEIEKEKYT